MSDISPEHLQIFFERFPLLSDTLRKLTLAEIDFAIGGSSCLFLLGNERLPDGVDIYIPGAQHDEADRLFGIESFTYQSAQENVRNSNPEGNYSIQLTSGLVLTVQDKEYNLELTSDVLAARLRTSYKGQRVILYPPEDVLLVKALLQRGADVGKHDVVDIKNFRQIYPDLRMEYLQSRVATLGAAGRVTTIFDN